MASVHDIKVSYPLFKISLAYHVMKGVYRTCMSCNEAITGLLQITILCRREERMVAHKGIQR